MFFSLFVVPCNNLSFTITPHPSGYAAHLPLKGKALFREQKRRPINGRLFEKQFISLYNYFSGATSIVSVVSALSSAFSSTGAVVFSPSTFASVVSAASVLSSVTVVFFAL